MSENFPKSKNRNYVSFLFLKFKLCIGSQHGINSMMTSVMINLLRYHLIHFIFPFQCLSVVKSRPSETIYSNPTVPIKLQIVTFKLAHHFMVKFTRMTIALGANLIDTILNFNGDSWLQDFELFIKMYWFVVLHCELEKIVRTVRIACMVWYVWYKKS